ncbi:MAG: hypothetical protein U9N77_11500 [Thermodesulfobacteriota bacterium]|nr:hypothetical protein [Thermodesulfobacteriota bacterium]
MGQAKKEPLSIEKLAANLATYAIDRDDLKMLIQAVPEESNLNITTVEYELQILKILSVGWGISFYMPGGENKTKLTQLFWQHIREISKNISNITETTTGQSIDYFLILKERLDIYVKNMQKNPNGTTDPSLLMGPAFADACGCPDNAVAILTGTKMFALSLGGIKEYLNAVEIE